MPWAVYGVLIAVFLRLSWMKWGDLVIDTGREMYVPAELLAGRVLYRDIAYYFGPLTPYLNALFYRIGGVQVGSLVVSGLLSLVLTLVALHRLSKMLLDGFSSLLVGATFIAVCAFGFYWALGNYNYIIPYTYSATYGMAFALLGLYFFLQNAGSGARGSWVLPALFFSAALLARYELGVMALAAVVLSSLILRALDQQR